jgi:hypothetical protein
MSDRQVRLEPVRARRSSSRTVDRPVLHDPELRVHRVPSPHEAGTPHSSDRCPTGSARVVHRLCSGGRHRSRRCCTEARGALLHGDRLLLPYGASDASVRFAIVDVPLLLEQLVNDGPPAATRDHGASR